MPAAEEMFDPRFGFAPTITRTWDGWTAQRFFRVDSPDPEIALFATGIPLIGTAHPDGFDMVVREVTHRSYKGVWSIIVVSYATRGGSFGPPDEDATTETVYSSARAGLTGVEVNFDTSGDPLPEPATKEVAASDIVVTAYRANANWLDHATAIQGKVNSNAIVLPNFRGLPGTFSVSARQLLARGFSHRYVKPTLIAVDYVFGIGPVDAWKVTQGTRDANGRVSATNTYDVQETTAFTTSLLWG